jgi:two-component system CheB/CheR fusion protein
MTENADPSFEALLDFLKRARGIDFTGYRRTSLRRRFERRLDIVGCRSFGEYVDFLEVHPEEYEELFDTLLINVTEFFRDARTWAYLQDTALPRLLGSRPADEPVRVWSAGCASGEEAYTIAMVLAEQLGLEEYRERVKIYATDVDEEALDTARQALYPPKAIERVPAALREKYFERADQRHGFREDLRRTVIFGRNNLVQDAPISRLDLLVCRNTLMYFTAEMQSHVLRHYHFALRDNGVLVLGRPEMIISHRDLFAPLDLEQRVFARASRPQARRVSDDGAGRSFPDDERQRDIALEVGPLPQVIVSRSGRLTFANLPARALFHVRLEDFGRPFGDLDVSSKPVELRGTVDEVLRERRRVPLGEIRYVPDQGEERRLDVVVAPLLDQGGVALGASIVFTDVTRLSVLRQEVDGHRHELEQAYEELQSTIDELETTNEELHSANEELQTTNEELHSTNEELETLNEGLQSANAELETINDELRDRTGELHERDGMLEAILSSLGVGLVVIDKRQRVRVWNRCAADQWGVRPDEAADQHFLSLDLGLPTEKLAPALRAVLGGSSERERLELDAVNRRGRAVVCATSVMPLLAAGHNGREVRGAIILMQDAPR